MRNNAKIPSYARMTPRDEGCAARTQSALRAFVYAAKLNTTRPGTQGITVDIRLPTVKLPAARKPTPAWSDEDLVEECLRGSQQAWSAVVEKYQNLVYSAPVKYRMTPQDAADIFQEVWVELHAELKNVRKPGALGSWLISVASHKCYHWKRKRLREAGQNVNGYDREAPAADPLYLEWKVEAERAQILRDTVARLPERCRRMVHLLFYQDPPTPYLEVARQLGVAEGSIGFMRGRCLQKLREDLERGGY